MTEITGEVNHYTIIRTFDNDAEIVDERTADIVTIDRDYLEAVIDILKKALQDIEQGDDEKDGRNE